MENKKAILAPKRKRKTRVKSVLTPEQERNAFIFRLRGFYSNAKTLPFTKTELNRILECVDDALERLGAETQTSRLAFRVGTPKQ